MTARILRKFYACYVKNHNEENNVINIEIIMCFNDMKLC